MAKKRPRAADHGVPPADMLAALQDALPEAVYFKDRESRFLWINKAHAAWLGVSDPAQAVGKSDFDFFTQEFARAASETEQEVLRTGKPIIDREEKIVWPGGRMIWASASKRPLHDAAGAIVGTFGVSRDISEEKRAEERLRDSMAMYESLVESLPFCLFRKDLEGRVVYGNKRYCDTLGCTLKDLLGKTDFDLFPKKLAEKYRHDDARVLRHGGIFETIEEHRPPRQRQFKVRVIKTPVYDSRDRIVGVQGMFWRMSEETSAHA
jgi:PAS domain S-box-containing protein